MKTVRWAFLFAFLILLTVPELFLRLFGINLFLSGALVFYCSIVFGVPYGLTCAVLCGMILDFCSGWGIAWSIPWYLLMVPASRFWLARVDSGSKWLLIVPGFLLAFLSCFPAGLTAGGVSSGNFVDSFADSIAAGISGAVIFPLLILMLDYFSKLLKTGNFTDARESMNRDEE